MGNSTDAIEIISDPAVTVHELQWSHWLVLMLLIIALAACSSDPQQTFKAQEQGTPAPSGVPTARASITVSGPDDRPPTDDAPQQATLQPADRRAAPVVFPRHNAPLGTDRGEQYTAGKLVLEGGCLRVEVPARGANPRMSRLVIWPDSFTFEEESGSIRIIDGLGRTAAQVGDHIRVSRAAVTYQQARVQEFIAEGVEHCAQPSTWAGDEVTVFDPENEATELRLSDPHVLLFRQKTVMAVNRSFPTAAGIGEMVLDGQCLRLKGEYSINTIIWPAGLRSMWRTA